MKYSVAHALVQGMHRITRVSLVNWRPGISTVFKGKKTTFAAGRNFICMIPNILSFVYLLKGALKAGYAQKFFKLLLLFLLLFLAFINVRILQRSKVV